MFKDKFNKAKESIKLKTGLLKTFWKSIEPTIKAKHIPFILKSLRIVKEGKIVYYGELLKAEFIKYKNRVGIHVITTNELPVLYKLAQKTGDIRHMRDIDYAREVPIDFTIDFGRDTCEMTKSESNLVYYKGNLVECELPFSDTGEIVRDGVIITE